MQQNCSTDQADQAAETLAEAVAWQDRACYAEAEAALRRVLTIEPAHAEAWTRLGWILNRLGRVDEAISAHRQATQALPGFAGAWSNLGVALQAKGEHDQALRVLQHAVSLDPELAQSRVNLGLEWQARGWVSEAIACYRAAIVRNPGLAETWINLGISLLGSGDVALACVALRRALELQPGNVHVLSNLQMFHQYAPNLALADLRREAELAGAVFGVPLPAAQRGQPAATRRRIRVGYVSGDFYAHPIGWMAARSLCAHDRAAVEVHCYADQRIDDFMTAEIRAGVEHWHSVGELSDAALRDLIRSHEIDILVDLGGHTASNRLAVFAARAAPVQLGWLGFAASTGVAAMDGVLLGQAMAPAGVEDAFSEAVMRLPCCHFTYRPPDYAPAVTSCPEEQSGRLTLGSFNNPAKLGMDVLRLWARILLELPASRLVLKWRSFADPAVAQRLQRGFAFHGVDPARIEFRGASSHADMLAEYGDIDIALDPYPYCGGLTTCEALWMGVPVVTLPWLRPMSRQGLAILQAIGLDDLVAASPRQYVAIVRELAAAAPRRAELRRSLRERVTGSALFDGTGLARALEARYAEALAAQAVKT